MSKLRPMVVNIQCEMFDGVRFCQHCDSSEPDKMSSEPDKMSSEPDKMSSVRLFVRFFGTLTI